MELNNRNNYAIWHPYTQMQTAPSPISIAQAKDEFLIQENGTKIIDAISSWWVNLFGHCNPYVSKHIQEQAKILEQVIFAGFTHPRAIEVSQKLLKLLPPLQAKVFFSDNGSTAVEVALKMCLQYFINKEQPRKKILAIEGAYHGDTFGAMSVSARGTFTKPFHNLLFDVDFIPFPFPGKEEDALQFINELNLNDYAAFILEPLVQGSAGMRMYHPEVLQNMIEKCRAHNVLIIADEVFTGFGRTGKLLAMNHITADADIYCFSKGITGGFLPMGLTTTTQKIYDAFLSEQRNKMLFHGHSYTGNAIACAAASASLDLMSREDTYQNINRIGLAHSSFLETLQSNKKVEWARQLGTILAFELKTKHQSNYLNPERDHIYNYFMQKNILIRPLGNTIYLLPPYCTSNDSLNTIYQEILNYLAKD